MFLIINSLFYIYSRIVTVTLSVSRLCYVSFLSSLIFGLGVGCRLAVAIGVGSSRLSVL